MVTLKDVARLAGVDPSTVSRALDPARFALVNPATRARVREASEQLGFRLDKAASGLRRGRTFALGVIVADLSNPFAAPIIRGIENNLEGRGYLAYITETQDDHTRFNRVVDHLLSRRVDAIITLASRAGDEATLRSAARELPVVLAVRDLAGSGLAGVVCDDELGGRMAAEHLIGLGHRQLGQIHGPRDIATFSNRGSGFLRRAQELGASVTTPSEAADMLSLADGVELMKSLMTGHKQPPTAVFAHNDTLAIGAMKSLQDLGLRCPEDVSLIGYNDSQFTAFTNPPLTTISLPGYQIGRFAADMALGLIDMPNREPTVISLSPRLVERASTAPATGDESKSQKRRRPGTA